MLHALLCTSIYTLVTEWIDGTHQFGSCPGLNLLWGFADVITTSRHLSPRDLALKPCRESRSGTIVGKHVEALTRSESMMGNDGEAAEHQRALTTRLTSTTDDRDDHPKGLSSCCLAPQVESLAGRLSTSYRALSSPD